VDPAGRPDSSFTHHWDRYRTEIFDIGATGNAGTLIHSQRVIDLISCHKDNKGGGAVADKVERV